MTGTLHQIAAVIAWLAMNTLRVMLMGMLCGVPLWAWADKAPPPHALGHAGHGGHGGDKPMVHRFEDPKHWAKVFEGPARDAWQKPKDLVKSLALAPGMAVADVGAGTGYLMPHLAEAVGAKGQVIAIDIEPQMVKYLTERAQTAKLTQVSAQLGQPSDPKLGAASVDRIVILDTWHHVPARIAYAQKLLAALRPGGMLYIVDFTKDSPEGPPAKHRLLPEQVQLDLQTAGFVADVIPEELPNQYIVRGKKP